MKNFTVEHKFCGQVKEITGYDIYDAMKRNNISLKYWAEKK